MGIERTQTRAHMGANTAWVPGLLPINNIIILLHKIMSQENVDSEHQIRRKRCIRKLSICIWNTLSILLLEIDLGGYMGKYEQSWHDGNEA